MRVLFSNDALNHPGSARHLTAIWWMFADGRHTWVIEELEAVKHSAWLLGEGQRLRNSVLEHARKSARSTARTDLYVERVGSQVRAEQSTLQVPADRAERHLRQPVVLLVENARCDGAFVRHILLRVGAAKLRRSLGEAGFARLQSGWSSSLGDGVWFTVRHGAGRDSATQLDLLIESEPDLPPRTLVLVDSDRDRRDGPLGSSTAQQLTTRCQERARSIRGWLLEAFVLDKREVENYIPREALKARLDGEKWDMWCAWNEDERDFKDLKQHLHPKLWKVMVEPRYSNFLHERAWRERAGRNGRELDELIQRAMALL